MTMLCVAYYMATNLPSTASSTVRVLNQIPVPVCNKKPLRIVFYQDVTGSIKKNGVEVINAEVFAPIFSVTDRNIDLNFGCITDSSAHKLISVTLPAITFIRPTEPDTRSLPFAEEREITKQYINSLKEYRADSIAYYIDRNKRISTFKVQVDALVEKYRDCFAKHTDVATAVAIADRAFSSSQTDNAINYLLLNSDGKDSYVRVVPKLANRATVVLIGANAISHTALDSLVPIAFQSTEQAITYTIN